MGKCSSLLHVLTLTYLMNDSRKKGRELLIRDGEERATQEWIKVQLSVMIMFLMRFLGFPSSLKGLPPLTYSFLILWPFSFLFRGLQLLSFPNPGGDPRAQIFKLADLSYMLRECLAVNGV